MTCIATVDYVGNSSMDITVEVYSEQPATGEPRRNTHTAHVVFVAIDDQGRAHAGAAAHRRDRGGEGADGAGAAAPGEPQAVTSAILVLSGGGAKAAAHCGAVRALRERGIEPSRYVATSMGAVVAAALAAGAEPDTVVRALMNEAPAGHPCHIRWPPWRGSICEGLVRPRPFRDAVGRIIGVRRFADLKVPLTVTAVDVEKLELVVFGHGGIDAPLLDVLAATCALPPYFPAVSLGGRMLRDGGLMGHLPLSVVGETGGQPVIAVDVGPGIRQRA